jgi:cell division protein ZapE
VIYLIEQRLDGVNSLVQLFPEISVEKLMGQLQPPPEFASSRFDNYRPDPNFPTQARALQAAQQFVTPSRKLFAKQEPKVGIYLDGGFGVGKTHLLASIWHEWSGRKAFGSFLEYTSLIGYLTFSEAVKLFSNYKLVCIDEFELDDPGDTMMMSRFLKELSLSGTRFAATSNTPPNALGQGRFAAEDFKREISGIAERFEIVSVDGEDFRHRDIESHSRNMTFTELSDWLCVQANPYLDSQSDLLAHLAKLHPTKYRQLISDVGVLGISNVRQLSDQVSALRFVVFVDRLYEQQIPLRTAGDVAITEVFSKEMLEGGYRKKYLRAVSRLGSLTELY